MGKVDSAVQASKAESNSARWLADGNAAAERGNSKKAEACYEKSQYWLDRANALRDRASLAGAR